MGRTKKRRLKPNDSLTIKKGNFTFKFGNFLAQNVRLQETSINNLVLRVPLQQYLSPVIRKNGRFYPKKQSVQKTNTESVVETIYVITEAKTNEKPNRKNSIKSKPVTKCKPQFSPTIITLDFIKLSKLISTVPLPSWNCTVGMKEDLTITVQFINKLSKKSVTLSQINPKCDICISGHPIQLLGCPKTVDSLKDLQILLEIVNRLDFTDCMVYRL